MYACILVVVASQVVAYKRPFAPNAKLRQVTGKVLVEGPDVFRLYLLYLSF